MIFNCNNKTETINLHAGDVVCERGEFDELHGIIVEGVNVGKYNVVSFASGRPPYLVYINEVSMSELNSDYQLVIPFDKLQIDASRIER